MRNWTTTLVLMAVMAAPGCGRKGDAPTRPTIRVTGIPDENPTRLSREYQPLIELLSEALDADVSYVPVTDYSAAVQALASGTVDFAWLGGFTHVQARNQGEVVPLVMRDIDREFRSVFIVATSAGITEVAEVEGKKFAFGSKSSTSGHLMPRHYLLTEHGIDPDRDFDGEPVFSGAHDATVKIVESGRVAAGAVNKQVWERMVAERSVDTSKVAVIWETPPYVDYVWTARAAVPEQVRARFAAAFLGLDAANPRDKAVLDRMGAVKYVGATPADFDAIEAVARRVGMLE